MTDAHQDEYFDIRLKKLRELESAGVPIYPDRFPESVPVEDVLRLPVNASGIRTAGRLVSMRKMGKLIFAHIQDITGKIQIALRRDGIGTEAFKRFKTLIDIGDIIGVEGNLFRTRTGELTVDVSRYSFLSKALHPLPEKWHGLTDTEMIYRRRYLDLIMSEHARKKFLAKSKLIQVIRSILLEHGFVEVETPVLQPKPSGALARPFVTHHKALDLDVYLRIAPETYLKRLLVGGFNRIFEFARCFRNEGVSPDHLQDFTMLEYYVAYWNYEDNMSFTEMLIQRVLDDVMDSQKITFGDDVIDFSGHWPKVDFFEMIRDDTGIDLKDIGDADELRRKIEEKHIPLEMEKDEFNRLGLGALTDALYKRVSRPKLRQPVFLTGHPLVIPCTAKGKLPLYSFTAGVVTVTTGMNRLNRFLSNTG
jgi:lysyl-tRNA synthetase class 2